MTAHLLVMYPHPANAETFDRAYREEHLPFARPRLEGATGVATRLVVGPAWAPPPWHLISDVSLPRLEAVQACARSNAGQQALAHAASISSGGPPTLAVLIDQD